MVNIITDVLVWKKRITLTKYFVVINITPLAAGSGHKKLSRSATLVCRFYIVMLGIPRCASKILKFLTLCIVVLPLHCKRHLNRSPLDGLLRINARSVFTSTLGTPGQVLCLQRPLAGRLPPSYFSSSLVQALLVNALHFLKRFCL
jgi:hypothetical protein